MTFSETFHPLKLLERMSFSSASRCLSLRSLRRQGVGAAVVAHDFEQGLIGAVDVFELEIKDGIDPVLAQQWADAVLQPEAGEQRALAGRGLTVEVEFGRPPGLDAVLEFESGSHKRIAALGGASDALGGDFEVAGLLQFLGIGDEVVFLGVELRDEGEHREADECVRGKHHDSTRIS